MRFTETITIYNKIPQHGREPEKLRRTVVHGVFWDYTTGAAFGKSGKDDSDSITVMIPDMPALVPAAEWFRDGCPEDKFKLSPGDIIARGECGDISSAAELERQHTEKLIITAVRDCRFGSGCLLPPVASLFFAGMVANRQPMMDSTSFRCSSTIQSSGIWIHTSLCVPEC